MTGVELFLGALGALIPAVQAAIKAKSRLAKPTEARVHAKNIAELNDELFAAIYSNLQLYEEVVVQSVDEKDQVFASNVQRSIYKIIKKSQETAQELHNAGEEKSRALQCKFGEYARYLNNFQLSMTNRLLLQNFQRLGRDGDIAFLNTPTAPSESLSVTLRSDIEPIRVRYEDDLQLKRAFDRKDTTTTTTTTTMLESLFDSQDNNTPTSRPSLALLHACRKRLPNIVKFCLEYSADPTVTDEDGLGPIHNIVGTADMINEPLEIKEILTLLIDRGVEPSARDYTKEQSRPLHQAVKTKNVSVTKFLLEKDPDMVNLVDGEGKTALYRACTTPSQNKALIEELVDKKADFGCKPRPPSMPDHGGQAIARYLDGKDLT